MPETKRPQAKRLFLVNRELQLGYAKAAMFVGLMSTLLTTVLILYPLFAFEILRMPRFLPLPILLLMGLGASLNLMLICGLSVLFTHRLAGPLFSLVRAFREVGLGALGLGLQVRAEDELKFVVRNFNAMVASLCLLTEQDAERLGVCLQTLEKAQLPADAPVHKAIQDLQALRSGLLARCQASSQF